MEQVVSSFLTLLCDTERFLRSSPKRFKSDILADFLRDFRVQRVNPLHKRMSRLTSDRYVLSMVGLTNVGKSTLAQALLNHPIAPRRNGPATTIPVEYEYAPDWRITTHHSASKIIDESPYATAAELGSALERKVFFLPAEQASKICRVLVCGPIDILRDGLIFADTPGFGAAYASADGVNHDAALVSYLTNRVHEVMFCVSGANCMIRREEEAFFNSLRSLCTTVIVTKWDAEGNEAARYRELFASHFPLCDFQFVEAKWAIDGQQDANLDKVRRSGIDQLRDLIGQRRTLSARQQAIKHHLNLAWQHLQALSREPLSQMNLPAIPWHQAALPRFVAAASEHHMSFSGL